MKKILLTLFTVLAVVALAVSAAFYIMKKKNCGENGGNGGEGGGSYEYAIELKERFSGKVLQWQKTLGEVKRNIPKSVSSEGLNPRYPTYGTSLSGITDEEKDALLKESSLLIASDTTYDAMDENGNLFLGGEPTGKTLYKHASAAGMYYGDVSDDEPAVCEQITVNAIEQRNYVTGLYAPAGEVIKIEISEEDLAAIGGELLIAVGQVSHRNVVNNIWKARNDFSRMPVIGNKMKIKSTTAYAGFHLGGPIYIYPATFGKTFTVRISGAVKYARYTHGRTTREEVEEMKNYSAPYYDFEVWDLGVRFSGPARYGSFDYDNLVKTGDLWEKIVRTSRRVPCSANAAIGVGFVCDCFVAAGEACAFQGGHSWVNAPCSWLAGATNYDSMVTDGFWGVIHEFNHLYQSYGLENTKTNEVSNNATSLVSYALYTKISDKRSTDDNTLTGWNRYTDPSRSLRETLAAAENGKKQNSLNAYADILHAFGADVYTKAAGMQKVMGVDNWYEALSLATGYNFTYYFEKLLGQTVSQDKKSLYDDASKPTFVPVACVFQTGRSYFADGEKKYSQTVRPYLIDRGKPVEVNFNERLILPSDFSFEIKSVSVPDSGTFEKIAENVYRYVPDKAELSGNIYVTTELKSEEYGTQEVTLTLNFRQFDRNRIQIKKYSYDGETKYSTVEEALNADFAGYTKVEEYESGSTFINGLSRGQIGVAEGKIYIEKTGEYAICLRSGRGNNTLYLAVNDLSAMYPALSLDTDHIEFALDGEHVVKLSLNAGDYLFFKEITLSRHYADAFTELGLAYLGDPSPVMKTVPTRLLCTFDMLMPKNDFTSEERYKREYFTAESEMSDSSAHKLVEVNMNPWSESEGVQNIFDGNPDTFYHNERNNFINKDNPFILSADTGAVNRYNGIKIVSRKKGQLNLPSSFILYGSKDNESWTAVGEFNDLAISGNYVYASFETAEFRYYRLYVTDTKSATAGNKYVTIAGIELRYDYGGTEKSPYALAYYGEKQNDFYEEVGESSFGTLIKGAGKIKYTFNGNGLKLFVRQTSECVIKLTANGKTSEIKLSANGEKTAAFLLDGLTNGKNDIIIEVTSGIICIDSVVVYGE